MILLTTIAVVALAADPPLVTIDRDNIEITQSCRVRMAPHTIADADGNGAVHITGSDISVEFVADSPPLNGAAGAQLPDSFTGTGIVVTGRNVTLSGARVQGFKVGMHARKADGLTMHHCNVSDNFAQHLKSTPQAEDGGDWLWPHNNDDNEWITNYGAGLCIEDSTNVTLHGIRARRTQNGIILDAVNDSKVYDCDCSFLSGWGLAMWRSSRNVISRNAFDFCVRGYSHGVYNRGQDSAGILMFEQCCENLIAENSCTHSGDGFFGFAGKEALGEVNPRDDLEWYTRRGNNDNVLMANDFSYAPAHGIEMTFSFGNAFIGNRLVANAICGVWGGYSRESLIAGNMIESNGEMAYGLERGGVNIEHGRANELYENTFRSNRCGVHLWSDDDGALKNTPWARTNKVGSSEESILSNVFDGNDVDVQLRGATSTVIIGNRGLEPERILKDQSCRDVVVASTGNFAAPATEQVTRGAASAILGTTRPVGARANLAGRENIIMTEWGPWDHESPLLRFVRRSGQAHEYRLLKGAAPPADKLRIEGDVAIDIVPGENLIVVHPNRPDTLQPYSISFDVDGRALSASGMLSGGAWTVKTFASPCDPREDVERWRAAADGPDVHTLTCDPLDLPFGSGGLTQAHKLPAILPRDHFGVIATRTLTFPRGKWRIDTNSDDGIRVWLDDQVVIDDWTWHAPKKQSYDFEVAEARVMTMRVEYFELDGFATLQVAISQARAR